MALVLDGTLGITTNSGTAISASTIGVGGATPSASGAGITFPATQSASTDANTLDDYEEGTFTPALAFATSGSVTYTTRAAKYIKVGQQVTINFWIYGATRSSPNGTCTITGLPFIASSAGQYRPAVYLRTNQISITGNLVGWIADSTSVMTLEITNNGGLTAQLNGTSISGDNFEFGCAISYITN